MAVEIRGLEGILERLEGIADYDKMSKTIETACFIIERSAKQKAPKSIAPTIKTDVKGLTGTVYTPVEYAPYVEFGTGIHSIHPDGGRQEVPWVYVEGSTVKSKSKTIYTDESARKMVAAMREQGLDAHMTYGQHPQPFLRPALDENRDKIVEKMGESMLK